MRCGARHTWLRAARQVPHKAAERLCVSSLVLFNYSNSQHPDRRNLSTSALTNDGRFWRRFVGALVLTAAGGTVLAMIAPHEPSEQSVSQHKATPTGYPGATPRTCAGHPNPGKICALLGRVCDSR